MSLASNECYKPLDPVRIVSSSKDDSWVNSASIQVNGAYVTDIATITPNGIVIQPIERFAVGIHTIAIHHTGEDSESVVRLHFETCRDVDATNMTFDPHWQSEFHVNQLLHNSSPLTHSGSDTTSSGAANFNFEASNKNLNANLSANLVHDSRAQFLPEDKRWDVGHYLLQITHNESVTIQAGHHEVDHTSLLMEQWYRPGMSLTAVSDVLSSRIQVFSFHQVDETGLINPLSTDSENRVTGVVWDFWPFRDAQERLQLTAAYVDATSHDGEDDPDFATSSASHGHALSLNSTLFDYALTLEAEYAHSASKRRDFGLTEPSQSGVAKSVGVDYQAPNDLLLGFSVGAKAVSIDPDYYSITNDFLGSDRNASELYGLVTWNRWSLDLKSSRERDNLERQLGATTRIDTNQIALSLISSGLSADSNFNWAMGNFTLTAEEQDRTRSAHFFDTGVDATTQTLSLQGNHNLKELNWFWRIEETKVDDRAGSEPNSTTLSFSIGAGYQIPDHLDLSFSIGRNRTRYDNQGNAEFNSYSLHLRPKLGRFQNAYLNIDYADTHNTSFGSLIEEQNSSVGIGFTTHLIKPQKFTPGLNLTVTGSYLSTNSLFASRDSGLQLFMKFTLVTQANQTGGLY